MPVKAWFYWVMPKPLPTVERMKQVFSVVDGELVWEMPTSFCVRKGDKAGYIRKDGRLHIRVDGTLFLAYRALWALHYGEWPVGEIDHINGDTADNRIDNLRIVSSSENKCNKGKQRNNTSGYKGVWFHTQAKKWCAEIAFKKTRKKLGLFDSPQAAHQAYKSACIALHGKFARTE